VRTGTGPSFAAIPPNWSRVISAVLAPSLAARSAATTPAGPAPTTTTSNGSGGGEVMTRSSGLLTAAVLTRTE
jgi:hypothetical protein